MPRFISLPWSSIPPNRSLPVLHVLTLSTRLLFMAGKLGARTGEGFIDWIAFTPASLFWSYSPAICVLT